MTGSPVIRFGILTVSDRAFQGVRPDQSGPALETLIKRNNWKSNLKEILPDDFDLIREFLRTESQKGEIDIMLTTGGTGFAERDITPEATLAVVERLTPGIPEAMRAASIAITPHGVLSRGVAGIANKMLIINLPGSPKAAVEHLQVVLQAIPHAVQLLRDDPDSERSH